MGSIGLFITGMLVGGAVATVALACVVAGGDRR